jgi:hypothetical protein
MIERRYQMKKIATVGLVLVSLFLLSAASWGLNTPEVIKDHGAITGRYVNDNGLIIGAEYGFGSKLAVKADIGEENYTRIGLKYEVNPNLALEAGFFDSESAKLFFGINGATSFSEAVQGIIQTDLFMLDNQVNCNYELGLKVNLGSQFDIRGGVMGTIVDSESTTNLELGMGYRF